MMVSPGQGRESNTEGEERQGDKYTRIMGKLQGNIIL